MATYDPNKRRPEYGNAAECVAYNVAYARGFTRRAKQHTLGDKWPNAFSRGYWDGWADNPKGER
jgi:hypothetical protein